MNKVKLTIAGGTIILIGIIGSLGISKDDVAIEETPVGIFVNMSDLDFDTLRNGLANKCANDGVFSSMEEYQLFIDVLNHQIEKDGGEIVLKNTKGSLLKEVCKYLIR